VGITIIPYTEDHVDRVIAAVKKNRAMLG